MGKLKYFELPLSSQNTQDTHTHTHTETHTDTHTPHTPTPIFIICFVKL